MEHTSELADLRKECVTSLYQSVENVCKYGEDMEQDVERLRNLAKAYCMLGVKLDIAPLALEKAREETNISNVNKLPARFKEHLNDLALQRLNINTHPYMTEMEQRIERGKQAKKIHDESILGITGEREQFIDPISKRPIEDPVKNSVCGHIYERDSIMNLINMKKKTRCPVAGCGNKQPVLEQHLISDDELRFRMTLTQHSTMLPDRSVLDLDSD